MRYISIVCLLLLSTMARSQALECVITKEHSLSVRWEGKDRLTGGIPFFKYPGKNTKVTLLTKEKQGVAILSLVVKEPFELKANEFASVLFDSVQHYKQGVALWCYQPSNNWTKPIAVTSYADLPAWDVQFYYWQYDDGTYGAMVPMSGQGYRTTVGKENERWGSKAVMYINHQTHDIIPAMAIAFGKDPYALFKKIYRVTLEYMGQGTNLQSQKTMPEPFQYLGWCSWNSSDLGKKLNEQLLINAAKSFYDHQFPLGWILIDDGWLQQHDGQLQSIIPDKQKFPQGFKPVISKLKKDYRISYVGAWHAFNAHWNGIDPGSVLGKRYQTELFTWALKDGPSTKKKHSFIKPESDSLHGFYAYWHAYLKGQGIDFIKVDNQSSTEPLAFNNYPLFTLSQQMHQAMNASALTYFNNAIINCMDMTAEAYFNFGGTAVARAVEDYFPYEQKENYNLEHGNAAAHVVQAAYNSIYFSQMVFPDFDMFQSHNPNATYHAIARALNNGPVYITDNIGEQNFDILKPLVFADGRLIKSETSLLPTEDCLFQIQDTQLFKAYSRVRTTGLLGVWNAADTSMVRGTISPNDVSGISAASFLLYEYFSKEWKLVMPGERVDVTLPRMGYKLFYVIPLENDFAPVGLEHKYNAPATITSVAPNGNEVRLTLYEGGVFKAYARNKPKKITINGVVVTGYKFNQSMLAIDVPFAKPGSHPIVVVSW